MRRACDDFVDGSLSDECAVGTRRVVGLEAVELEVVAFVGERAGRSMTAETSLSSPSTGPPGRTTSADPSRLTIRCFRRFGFGDNVKPVFDGAWPAAEANGCGDC